MTRDVQSRYWFLTENNPSEEEITRYKDLDCQWIAISKEHEDDEEKTPHIHIAIVFEKKRRCSTIKKLFPRAHIDKMMGTPQSCVTYMTKENPLLYEKGERPEKENASRKGGEKNKKRWEEAYEAAKEGRFEDIPRDLYVSHDRAFHRVYEENLRDTTMEEMTDTDLKDHFLWLWGPTGTGKSYWARKIAKKLDPEGHPLLKKWNKWWNGYKCNWVTIMEEADPERCKLQAGNLKEAADKWETSGEVKNGMIESMRPHYIIVTSNYSIEECFPNENDSGPLKRRFTQIYLDKKGLEVNWPMYPEIKQKAGNGDLPPAGNTIPQEEQEKAGVEPGAKRKRDEDETGLIDPPAILENTPSDFNTEELKED